MRAGAGVRRDWFVAFGAAALVACASPAGKLDGGLDGGPAGAGTSGSAGGSGSAGAAGNSDGAAAGSSQPSDAAPDVPADLPTADADDAMAPPSEGGAGPAMSAAQFCQAYQDLTLETLSRCPDASLVGTRRQLSSPFFCPRFVAGVQAGRMRFDGALAASCLETQRALLATCPPKQTFPGTDLAACGAIVTPLVPVGGACRAVYDANLGVECQGEAFCGTFMVPGACEGVCTARVPVAGHCNASIDLRCTKTAVCSNVGSVCVAIPPPGGAGTPCMLFGSRVCTDGLHCGSDIQVCTPTVASGPCSNSSDCAPPTHCARATPSSTSNTCVPIKKVGDPCTVGAYECAVAHQCDNATERCSAEILPIGAPCLQVAFEAPRCAATAYCEYDVAAAKGTCRAKKAAGDACTAGDDNQCDGNGGHCDQTSKKCVTCPL
jgi:hypothetical protein